MAEPMPVAAKLRILPGATVWVSDPKRASLLGTLPDGVRLQDAPAAATVAVVMADDATAIREALAAHAAELAGVGAFWVAYPKANRTDVNRDTLWPILAEHGFRPVSQVALDAVWSALRFRPRRADEAAAGGPG